MVLQPWGGDAEKETTPIAGERYLGKFHHDLTTTEPWKSWFMLGESSPFMALIQISELL